MSIELPSSGLRRDGLLLRAPGLDDVGTLHRAFNDPGILDPGDFPFDAPTPDFVRELVTERLPALRDAGELAGLMVVDAPSGRPLGGAALHHVDLERAIGEIGYWLLPEARGRGVATQVARVLAEWGFELGLERVEARTFVENVPSQRVLERAGFTREGLLRSMPRQRGGRGDMVVFSLLPGE